jgi:hypothetical protein
VGFSKFFDQPPIENTLNLSFAMASSNNNDDSIEEEDDDSTAIALTTTTANASLHPQLKQVFRNFPSMYELLPDFYYLQKRPLLYADTTPIYGVDNTYFNNDWKFSEEYAVSMAMQAMSFKKEKLGEKLPGKKENNLVIYGIEEPTDDTIVYQKRFFMFGSDPQTSHISKHEFFPHMILVKMGIVGFPHLVLWVRCQVLQNIQILNLFKEHIHYCPTI